MVKANTRRARVFLILGAGLFRPPFGGRLPIDAVFLAPFGNQGVNDGVNRHIVGLCQLFEHVKELVLPILNLSARP